MVGEGGGRAGGASSNFAFLETGWPELYAEAVKCEENGIVDPRISCFYGRRTLELSLNWLYDADEALRRPRKNTLAAMLAEPSFVTMVEPKIRTKMDLIRKHGNAAVHRIGPITSAESGPVVRELFHVLYWFARTYALEAELVPPSELAFDAKAIPTQLAIPRVPTTHEALLRQVDEIAAVDAEAMRRRAEDAALREQLEGLRKEVAQAKAANEQRPDDHDYDEESTRDLYIDLMLREAGWPLDAEEDREYEVTGMPNKSGVGFVDYVLWGADGKPLGLVEAKRTRRDPKVGQQQAKLYADCLEERFGRRPAIFYSNGYKTWLWDDARYPPRRVQGFYTREELALLNRRRTGRECLDLVEIKPQIVERAYQHHAIRSIGERFEQENQRKALIVMATGAGKTRTAIALADLLMRAGWVKRTLFLADRIALVKQAVSAFKTHLPAVATVDLTSDRQAEGRVYVSTYPTMMGLIGEGQAGELKRFGPGFFDLVVIDEAHRSVYQKYRSIFAYYDSLLLGLTATPKDEVDRNTYSLFDLKPGVPTDEYSLEEAVADGYLVPLRAIAVPLKFPRKGLKYADLSEEEQEQWDEQDWGDGEPPEEVDAEAVNRWLFNADTVDKMLETLMTKGRRVAGGDRIGKTIIFAKNNEHAEFIVERFDVNYPQYAGSFARAVTYRTEYAQSLIDDFSVKEKAPHIAVSVDMLDTGIDVPEVVNLVFFKVVRSRTKFWQMLGRGTRLCPGLYGPGQGKKDFFVFDCCGNFDFFSQEIEPSKGSTPPSLTQRLFSERIELLLALDESGAGDAERVRGETVALLREQVAGMNPDNFLVRPHREKVERYRERVAWDELDQASAAELANQLADLPTAAQDDDESAKRFDLIVLQLQLCRLRGEGGEERLKRQVQVVAAGLLEQTAIPVIGERQLLLEELAGEEWWVGVTVPMLEAARLRVRSLVRLLEKRKRSAIYTDFVDELGEVEEVKLPGISAGLDHEGFRERVKSRLESDGDRHVAVRKLRENVPLTPADQEELERIVIEADPMGRDYLNRLRGDSYGLGEFIRSLVGLDRSALVDAFSEFLEQDAYSPAQLDFINLLIDHLATNGLMDPDGLYEPPFADVVPQGPEELFPDADVDRFVAIIEIVRQNAEAPSD